jgi:hypothetical protein
LLRCQRRSFMPIEITLGKIVVLRIIKFCLHFFVHSSRLKVLSCIFTKCMRDKLGNFSSAVHVYDTAISVIIIIIIIIIIVFQIF